jgi:hypothetical protein
MMTQTDSVGRRRLWACSLAAALVCAAGADWAHARADGEALAAERAGAEPASLPTTDLSPAQVSEDLALLRRALETIHPGLYRYSDKAAMDARFAELERRGVTIRTDLDLYREISLLLAAIRCDHTKAELPRAIAAFRDKTPSFLPFRFRVFDGRMHVASSDPEQPGLARGDEIVAINGRTVAELFGAIRPAISVDGLTDAVKDRKLADDSDLLGCDFDHFYPVFFGLAEGFELRVRPWARRHEAGGGETTLRLRPVTFPQWMKLAWDGAPYRAEFHTSTSWRMLDEQTAYLRVDTFVNYRNPVEPASVFGPIFAAIAERKAQRLILDLRENGGGSTDATVALARAIIPKPFTWNRAQVLKAVRYGDLPKYIQSWGDPKDLFEPPMEGFTPLPDGTFDRKPGPDAIERAEQQPADARFAGEVTVLIGPDNASGSTMLIAKLKDAADVRLIGSPTGGSAEGPTAGQVFFTKLPNSGVTVRIPTTWNRMSLERFPSADERGPFAVGMGVRPDVLVVQSLEDFVAGRDSVLEAALK